MDGQQVELAGRNWLIGQLLQAGLEVARPERDRGSDLIVYADVEAGGAFVARPVQMKASVERSFSVHRKNEKFPDLILVFVWHLGDPAKTVSDALTYAEVVAIADAMGWTRTESWLTGGRHGKPGYGTAQPSERLVRLLEPHRMTPKKWRQKILRLPQPEAAGLQRQHVPAPLSPDGHEHPKDASPASPAARRESIPDVVPRARRGRRVV
jgi:hypothetical protein